jgi:hypothetical protein
VTGSGENSVAVTLCGDEALVLFEWLARTSDSDAPAPFVDHAERRVLWRVEAVLERPNRRLSLDAARAEYVARGGTRLPHRPPTEPT